MTDKFPTQESKPTREEYIQTLKEEFLGKTHEVYGKQDFELLPGIPAKRWLVHKDREKALELNDYISSNLTRLIYTDVESESRTEVTADLMESLMDDYTTLMWKAYNINLTTQVMSRFQKVTDTEILQVKDYLSTLAGEMPRKAMPFVYSLRSKTMDDLNQQLLEANEYLWYMHRLMESLTRVAMNDGQDLYLPEWIGDKFDEKISDEIIPIVDSVKLVHTEDRYVIKTGIGQSGTEGVHGSDDDDDIPAEKPSYKSHLREGATIDMDSEFTFIMRNRLESRLPGFNLRSKVSIGGSYHEKWLDCELTFTQADLENYAVKHDQSARVILKQLLAGIASQIELYRQDPCKFILTREEYDAKTWEDSFF